MQADPPRQRRRTCAWMQAVAGRRDLCTAERYRTVPTPAGLLSFHANQVDSGDWLAGAVDIDSP